MTRRTQVVGWHRETRRSASKVGHQPPPRVGEEVVGPSVGGNGSAGLRKATSNTLACATGYDSRNCATLVARGYAGASGGPGGDGWLCFRCENTERGTEAWGASTHASSRGDSLCFAWAKHRHPAIAQQRNLGCARRRPRKWMPGWWLGRGCATEKASGRFAKLRAAVRTDRVVRPTESTAKRNCDRWSRI